MGLRPMGGAQGETDGITGNQQCLHGARLTGGRGVVAVPPWHCPRALTWARDTLSAATSSLSAASAAPSARSRSSSCERPALAFLDWSSIRSASCERSSSRPSRRLRSSPSSCISSAIWRGVNEREDRNGKVAGLDEGPAAQKLHPLRDLAPGCARAATGDITGV